MLHKRGMSIFGVQALCDSPAMVLPTTSPHVCACVCVSVVYVCCVCILCVCACACIKMNLVLELLLVLDLEYSWIDKCEDVFLQAK